MQNNVKKSQKNKNTGQQSIKKKNIKSKNVEQRSSEPMKDVKQTVNKKRLKEIQAKKKAEYKKKQKELKKIQKQEELLEKRRLKKRLNAKEIQKIKRYKSMMKVCISVAGAVILLILLLLSPVFYIKDIKISGNNQISTNTILSLIGIEENTNMLKVTANSLKNKIKENAYIDTVKIKKVYPSTILIDVTERECAYMLEYASSYAYIDNQGYILEISKEPLEGKVKISGYVTSVESISAGNRLCQDDLKKLNIISQIMSIAQNIEIQSLITSITINKNEYSLFLESEGKKVELGDNTNLETKLLYVKEIVNRTKGEDGVIHVDVNLNEKRAYFTKDT